MFFPEDTKKFFGLLTKPDPAHASSTGVIMMSGIFGGTTTIGRNRVWVQVARNLAAAGHHALRLDFHGLGDSAFDDSGYALETPALPEAQAGLDLLAARGASELIPVGTCYGARTVLAAAARDDRVKALLLLAPPIRDGTKGEGAADHLAEYVSSASLAKQAFSPRYLRKLATDQKARTAARQVIAKKARVALGRPDRTDAVANNAAAGFAKPLMRLLDRGTPVHLVFGTEDYTWKEYEVAIEKGLGERLAPYGDLLTVTTVPGVIRGFLSERIQQTTVDVTLDWVARHT